MKECPDIVDGVCSTFSFKCTAKSVEGCMWLTVREEPSYMDYKEILDILEG